MFFKRNRNQKEIISQLKKENVQLRAEKDQLTKLYVEKDETLLAKQKIADEEKALFKKLNAEAQDRLEEARKISLEAKESARQVKEMKKRYEKAIDELNKALNAWNAQ